MNRKPLTILIDKDDVLVDLLTAWLEYLNKHYGTNVCFDDIREWDMKKAFPDLSSSQIYGPLNDPKLWENVQPIEKAAMYLQSLINNGDHIVIVTATSIDSMEFAMKNLFEHYPMLSWHDVIVTNQKYLIDGDILIDDKPDNHQNGHYEKILFDRPHNRNFDAESNGMHRVHNWTEVYIQIERIRQQKKK